MMVDAQQIITARNVLFTQCDNCGKYQRQQSDKHKMGLCDPQKRKPKNPCTVCGLQQSKKHNCKIQQQIEKILKKVDKPRNKRIGLEIPQQYIQQVQ